MKVNVGGFRFEWYNVESDFKYAQEASDGIRNALSNSYSKSIFEKFPVLRHLDLNKLCLDIFNKFVSEYSDQNLFNWFLGKCNSGARDRIKFEDINGPIVMESYASVFTEKVLSKKQEKFEELLKQLEQ